MLNGTIWGVTFGIEGGEEHTYTQTRTLFCVSVLALLTNKVETATWSIHEPRVWISEALAQAHVLF